MNSLRGNITAVEVSGSLSLVIVDIQNTVSFKSIVVETPATATYLAVGTQLNVLFKETEVVIGTHENHAVSLQNRIAGTIKNIETGSLITKIELTTKVGEIVSVISTAAVNQLSLKVGSEVVAMIKTNEIMLSE